MPENVRQRAERADSLRNRKAILDAAHRLFAEQGMAATVQQVARAAGVSTGTVSRHFPTKHDLYAAVFDDRARRLVELALELAESEAPEAFLGFFALVVEAGYDNRGLADALLTSGVDPASLLTEHGNDVNAAMRTLLHRAHRLGEVRGDLEYGDVKALMAGCLAHPNAEDHATRLRIIEFARSAMRAPHPEQSTREQ
jgi:AcrR family transcriptional regulator